jgi:glycosyltransferase involved in cell wall biosynthesis
VSEEKRPVVALVAHEVHDEGGMERAFAELVRRGHDDVDFVVIAARVQDDLRSLVRWERVHAVMRPGPVRLASFAALARLAVRRTRPDLVHALGAIVPGNVDLATVQFCHAAYAELEAPEARPSPARGMNRWAYRSMALAAERTCFRAQRTRMLAPVSPGVRRELDRHYPDLPSRITPNGVDVELFKPDPDQRVVVRRANHAHDDDVVALFVGGDWERKGLSVALQAVAIARSEGARMKLWVVGRGDAERQRRWAADLGVGSHISFFPPERLPVRFFQGADVFLFPTSYETFSLVAYEAAACELPVIAPIVSGIEDLIGDGTTGIPADRRPETVAAALTALAGSRELRQRLGAAGRRRAMEYGWDRSVACVLAAYDELLSASRASSLVSPAAAR